MKITLNQIKEYSPCANSWESLLGKLPEDIDFDKPLDVKMLIGLVPVRNAVWALRCLENKKLCVEFAIMCAESALHIFEEKYPDSSRPRDAIEAAKKWLADPNEDNRAAAARAATAYDYYIAVADYDAYTDDAYYAAANAHYAADAAYYAADAAVNAADTANAADAYAAAARAADAADPYTERQKQKQFLLELIDLYYGVAYENN